jgi:hypothetical protein
MTQPSGTEKDAAFRAVGRTIVNFQRLEHTLKLASRLGPMQGPTQKLQRDVDRRQQRADTLTLGQAIQAWLAVSGDTQAQTEWTPDLFDVSLQVTVALEPDPAVDGAHAKALSDLLEARNALVHARLATFPWESGEACEALVAELDALNATIGEQLEYFASLLRGFVAAHREAADLLLGELQQAFVGRDGGIGSMPAVTGQRRDP